MISPNTLLIPAFGIKNKRVYSSFPVGIYSIKEACRLAGLDVEILDFTGPVRERRFDNLDILVDYLLTLFDPAVYHLIGLSTMAGIFPAVISLAEKIKQINPQTTVVLGGPHSSFLSLETLADFPFIDAVVVGEGEYTFLEMIRAFQKSAGDWRNIPGVKIRGHRFTPRELLTNLDELPVIDYNNERLLYLQGIPDAGQIQHEIEAIRGCYARCRFCSTTQFWGCRTRRKSPTRLLDEMDRLAPETGISTFHFIGDNFTFPPKVFHDTCRYLIAKNSPYRWKCDSRIGDLHEDDLKLMKDAGCVSIFVGVESASRTTLQRINKNIDPDRTLAMIETALKHGLEIVSSFIIGFPWERDNDLMATLKLHSRLLEAGVSHSIVNPLFPLAGAEGFPDAKLITGFPALRESIPPFFQTGHSLEFIERYPRHFMHFGYYDTPHLSRSYINAVLETARQIREMRA